MNAGEQSAERPALDYILAGGSLFFSFAATAEGSVRLVLWDHKRYIDLPADTIWDQWMAADNDREVEIYSGFAHYVDALYQRGPTVSEGPAAGKGEVT